MIQKSFLYGTSRSCYNKGDTTIVSLSAHGRVLTYNKTAPAGKDSYTLFAGKTDTTFTPSNHLRADFISSLCCYPITKFYD